jgi:putative addiction module component (TIGR02574 family)
MEFADIQREALTLSDHDRASLAALLLDTLPPPGMDISDEEVNRREEDLESGRVTAISHEEFVRGVRQERGR